MASSSYIGLDSFSLEWIVTKLAAVVAVSASVFVAESCAQNPATSPAAKKESNAITRVTLASCKPIRVSGTLAFLLAMRGNSNTDLERRGLLKVDGREFPIYIPDGPYSVKNSGDSDQVAENDSTLVAVDADADGNVGEGEVWFANLPVRIADKMYAVVAIDDKGKWIDLTPSPGPLSGAVVGSTLPDFSYKSTDGKVVANADFRGRSYLIDIWSVT